MTNLLEHILHTALLDGVYDWPKSATRNKWFEIIRELIQQAIADMELDPDSMRELEKVFIGSVLL